MGSIVGNLLRGAALGVVELVPGVSAGTLALVLGIYRRLIDAVARVVNLLRAVAGRAPLRSAVREVPWAFLGALAAGMAAAILVFSRVVAAVLERHPGPLLAFFFAAVLISSLLPLKRVSEWRAAQAGAAITTAVATFLVLGIASTNTPAETPALWYLAISGAISASVMILPGVSGSFMLLLLGPYPYVIAQLRALPDGAAWPPLLVFGAGAAVGVATVAGGLSRLLSRAPSITYAALAGLMLGSLRRLWPFLADADAVAAGYNIANAPRVPIGELQTLPEGSLMPIMLAAAAGAAVAAFGAWLAWPGRQARSAVGAAET